MSRRRRPPRPGRLVRNPALAATGAALACLLTGAFLLHGMRDMPRVGDGSSPANTHPGVVRHYLEKSEAEIGSPNIVTSVLGDYRGGPWDPRADAWIVLARRR